MASAIGKVMLAILRNPKSRKRIIQLAVGLLMLGGLMFSSSLSKLADAIKDISLPLIITAAAGYAFTQAIGAIRWKILLNALGVPVSTRKVLVAQFIGGYFNAFGLGTVGGDIAKAMIVSTNAGSKTVCLASAVADRVVGLIVLALLGLVTTTVLHNSSTPPWFTELALGATALPVVFVISAFALRPYIMKLPFPKLTSTLNDLYTSFAASLPALPKIIAVALLFHVLQILLYGAITLEMGNPVPLGTLFSLVPVVNIASTLPLSWMGIGVRESLLVLFFSPYFMSKEHAILLGMVWFAGMSISSAVGGLSAGASTFFRRSSLEAEAQAKNSA